MTTPDRAAASGSDASMLPPAAAAQAGTAHRPPAVPAVPATPTTAGAAGPDTAPVVHHGWAAALTGEKAHWVPEGAPQDVHYGRPTGLTLDGWQALVDEQGLADGASLEPCKTCCRSLARLSAPAEPQS